MIIIKIRPALLAARVRTEIRWLEKILVTIEKS